MQCQATHPQMMACTCALSPGAMNAREPTMDLGAESQFASYNETGRDFDDQNDESLETCLDRTSSNS